MFESLNKITKFKISLRKKIVKINHPPNFATLSPGL